MADLYRVGKTVGMRDEDIQWLKGRRVLSTTPFVLTTYVGRGLSSHIDLNFEGPVFVTTVLLKENQNRPEKGIQKGISLGMMGK